MVVLLSVVTQHKLFDSLQELDHIGVFGHILVVGECLELVLCGFSALPMDHCKRLSLVLIASLRLLETVGMLELAPVHCP